ncbi:MAG: hypothetical protein WAW85_00530 [Gordonia sp. (in: high G+C Gram-positive bacteria)]|uniref:hypothetical protein n=1 Tax=Gordonia sp. (in: high G+C Gram-positive bacteria) TaxID=84139 RepID=UPI003BB55A87
MTDTPGSSAGGADGDPLHALLLGFATQIEQIAGVIGGVGAEDVIGVDSPLHGLIGELGSAATELGDLLSRLLSVLVALLQAISEALKSSPASARPAAATSFQAIPVRITAAPAHP